MWAKPRSVRKRSISSSGLSPASTRRNALSTSASSKTIEVLDCSAPIGRTSAPGRGGSTPSRQWNSTRACSPWTSAPSRSRPPSSSQAPRVGEGVVDGDAADVVDDRRRRQPSRPDARAAAGRRRACRRGSAPRPAPRTARAGRRGSRRRRARGSRPTSRALEPNQRRSSSHSASFSSSSAARSTLAIGQLHVGVGVLLEQEPEPAPRGERQQVGQLADAREARAPEHLLGPAPLVG